MFVSIIVPCFNEEDNIIPFYELLSPVISEYDYSIIFVDDGSKDDTLAKIKFLASQNHRITYLSLSRNFGHQNVLKAGYDHANADCTICMDADLQHPPEIIKQLISKWEEGYEIVYTVRVSQQKITFIKRITAKYFYKLLNYISNIELTPNTSDFRLIDRKVLEVIKSLQESQIFFRGFIAWVGFKQTGISYHAEERRYGRTKYSLKKMISFSVVGVTSMSISPLRISSLLGFTFSGLSFVYILYALYRHFFTNDTVPGWTSLIVSFLFVTGLQFIMIGIIGEYLGKAFIEAKKRPNYLVSEFSSSFSPVKDIRNFEITSQTRRLETKIHQLSK